MDTGIVGIDVQFYLFVPFSCIIGTQVIVIVIVVFQYRVPFNIIVRLIVGKDTGIRRGFVVVCGRLAIKL